MKLFANLIEPSNAEERLVMHKATQLLDIIRFFEELGEKVEETAQFFQDDADYCERKTNEFLKLMADGQENFKGGVKNYKNEVERVFRDISSKKAVTDQFFAALSEKINRERLEIKRNEFDECADCMLTSKSCNSAVLQRAYEETLQTEENFLSMISTYQDRSAEITDSVLNIMDEIEEKVFEVNEKYDVCAKLFEINVDKIFNNKLQYFVDETEKHFEICQEFSGNYEKFMQDTLISTPDFATFKTITQQKMEEYDNAYKNMRKNATEVFETCGEMKKALCFDDEGNAIKSPKKGKLPADKQQEWDRVTQINNDVQKKLDKTRNQLRQTQVKYKEKISALEIALQR